MISADMEGASGVTWTADVQVGTDQWQRFRNMFTSDVNACIAGLYAGGATDVLVNEAHSSQRNILLEDLDTRARMLTGRHKPLSMMQGVDSGIDGVVFLGYHTGAGVEGVLSHTYLPNQITGVWLDGVHASEGRLNTALATEHGVPVLLVTGDDLTCADAGSYAPEAGTVAVKECVSRYAAICLPPTVTAAAIEVPPRRMYWPLTTHVGHRAVKSLPGASVLTRWAPGASTSGLRTPSWVVPRLDHAASTSSLVFLVPRSSTAPTLIA